MENWFADLAPDPGFAVALPDRISGHIMDWVRTLIGEVGDLTDVVLSRFWRKLTPWGGNQPARARYLNHSHCWGAVRPGSRAAPRRRSA